MLVVTFSIFFGCIYLYLGRRNCGWSFFFLYLNYWLKIPIFYSLSHCFWFHLLICAWKQCGSSKWVCCWWLQFFDFYIFLVCITAYVYGGSRNCRWSFWIINWKFSSFAFLYMVFARLVIFVNLCSKTV